MCNKAENRHALSYQTSFLGVSPGLLRLLGFDIILMARYDFLFTL